MIVRALLLSVALAGSSLELSNCGDKASAANVDASQAAHTGPRIVKFAPDALHRLGVKVGIAGEETSAAHLVLAGQLEYNLERYAEIGVLVEGRVSSVKVRIGDAVKTGQVLASVVVPSIANAQAEYLASEAASAQARENANRESKLLEQELTTAHEAQVAKAEAQKAQANMAAAQARLTVLGIEIPKNQAAIQGAGTVYLKSPLDGVVVRRDAVLGAYLSPNEKAFVVADPTELWATVKLNEQDLNYLQIGTEVELTFDALPGKEVKGKVALMEPQIGAASRALRCRIAVPNKDGALKPGLFLRATVVLPHDASQDRIFVAPGAVQPLGDEDVVFVERSPGVFEVRPIKVGRRTSQVVEVVSGLSKGERIATEGGFLLRGEVTKQ